MKISTKPRVSLLLVSLLSFYFSILLPKTLASEAMGPLVVSQQNPRYFAKPDGTIVYLTGSHTWSTFNDNGHGYLPPAFDYTAHLDWLQNQGGGHNFIRLWTWEQTRWTLETTDDEYWVTPSMYVRVGPELAIDGLPKFDLTQFDQAYFDRLRSRVEEAQSRGMYVSIMLFNGWSNVSAKGVSNLNNPWKGHPFNLANNINGVNGDLNNNNSGEEVHELVNPAVTDLQKAYIRKVVDTVNDLDNVLYEISNESHSGSVAWQYELINYIKAYQLTKPYQHPVGMTTTYMSKTNSTLFNSPADWISVRGAIEGYKTNPPAATGAKVLITDTDHICGVCLNFAWVWKTFTRGQNPIYMDVYDGVSYGFGAEGHDPNDSTFIASRASMGYTLSYAKRMQLQYMVPLTDGSYTLANNTVSPYEFLAYRDTTSGVLTLPLPVDTYEYTYEWFNPKTGVIVSAGTLTAGGTTSFIPPFSGRAVLYLKQAL